MLGEISFESVIQVKQAAKSLCGITLFGSKIRLLAVVYKYALYKKIK